MSARYLEQKSNSKSTFTMTITSGKGGVGKSTLTANMAMWLARRGNRVLVLDGDMSMANLDILFSIRSRKTLHDVFQDEATLAEILVPVETNLTLIPGGSGIRELGKLTDWQRRSLLDQVSALPEEYDYFIIDTAPGIDDTVLYLNAAVHDVNVIVTPDPASLADSYALIKVLNNAYKESKFSIICNLVRDEEEGLSIFKRLSDVASKFLCVSLDYRGSIPNDIILRNATKAQQLVLKTQPQAPSSLAIRHLCENLKKTDQIENLKGSMQFFWERFFGVA